jgi:uncharacterized repeat protein (TIGR03803 family)
MSAMKPFVAVAATAVCFATMHPAMAGALKTLHTFSCTDGALPYGALLYQGSVFWGTTLAGGPSGCAYSDTGTVYTIDPETEAFVSVHAGALVAAGSLLYGVTSGGGASGEGTVFTIDPTSGAFNSLHSFSGADGFVPAAGLIYQNGMLYGTTQGGGDLSCYSPMLGCGIVFRMDPASGAVTTLHAFEGTDGAFPAAVLLYHNGALYGTTVGSSGGDFASTVFELNLTTNVLTTVHTFTGIGGDGTPNSGLIFQGGTFYGVADQGPAIYGSVYAIDATSGVFSTLHSFTGTDGQGPSGELLYERGLLYGVTEAGGANTGRKCVDNCGTVYAMNPSTGAVTTLYSFTNKAYYPQAALAYLKGNLYGTTYYPYNNGIIFKLKR